MAAYDDLLNRVQRCPPGRAGWSEFEDACIAILEYLLVPPLEKPKIQAYSLSGIDRRDAIFPNRLFDSSTSWGKLYQELDARMILFEFKNYNITEIGKEEVDQARSYLRAPFGKLAILCCNKKPSKAAYIRRNTVYKDDNKIILFIIPDQIKEMCIIKERGEDPADLIIDLVEMFYIEYE